MAFIKINDNPLYDEILVTEMRLDDLWLPKRKERNTLNQFREALKAMEEPTL